VGKMSFDSWGPTTCPTTRRRAPLRATLLVASQLAACCSSVARQICSRRALDSNSPPIGVTIPPICLARCRPARTRRVRPPGPQGPLQGTLRAPYRTHRAGRLLRPAPANPAPAFHGPRRGPRARRRPSPSAPRKPTTRGARSCARTRFVGEERRGSSAAAPPPAAPSSDNPPHPFRATRSTAGRGGLRQCRGGCGAAFEWRHAGASWT